MQTNTKLQATPIDDKPAVDRLRELVLLLKILKEKGFTGYVKVNYQLGRLSSVKMFEEILK